jgi:hypothetical protein
MPRPKTKSELLDISQQNFQKMFDLIDALSEEELNGTFPPEYMNRNVRDVLAHLYHWQLMMLEWYRIGMTGEKPDMPAKGYTWKDTSKLNHEIWEKYQETSLDEVRNQLLGSAAEIRKIIEQHSDEELFEKKRYKWTGSTSLGAYLISSTSSHYDWAIKLIKKYKKSIA